MAMDLMKVGLIGGGAYLLYRYFAAPSTAAPGTVGASPAVVPAGPSPVVPAPTTQPPASSTTPAVSLTADALTTAAGTSNLTPDQWNWYAVNRLQAQAFDLDSTFGNVGTAGRDRTYTASEFLSVARGITSPSAIQPATQTPATGAPTAPPSITIPAYSDSLSSAAFQAMQKWISYANTNQLASRILNTDGWNYYFSQATGQPGPAPEDVGISPRDATYDYMSYSGLMSKWLSTGQGLSGLLAGMFGCQGCGRGFGVLFPQIQTRRGNALIFPNIPQNATPARLVFGGGWR